MTTKVSESEKREHVAKLIEDFRTAMLVTRTEDGGLRSRPLSIADKRDDGTLYFSTSIESGKVHELERDPHVNVALQDGRRFVSLTGRARIVTDRAVIKKMWAEDWKIWFPQGPDDPSLCLVAVEPEEAWYWDAAGAAGLKYLYEMAKGYVTHTKPESDSDERHTGHVKM